MSIILKPGREKSILRRHPWVFSGAIQRMEDEPTLRQKQGLAPGATVDLLSFKGDLLARAAYSPYSQIRARVWTFDPNETVDADFFRKRIQRAIAMRRSIGFSPIPLSPLSEGEGDALRLIYAESDGIPGLIVDRYANVLVLQSLTAGVEHWKETIADILLEETGIKNIFERSDADVRELEGLRPKAGILRGTPPNSQITIHESNLNFLVDIARGHKTGFYLDQRANCRRVRELAKDRDVLDCFCYTGGFTVNALAGGAKSVLSVDSSADALALCTENIALNDLPLESHTALEGDIFQLLRKFRDEKRSFDMILLDPPKFAPTAAHTEKAARAYKDINLLAFKLLRSNGILVTFSCSGGVDTLLFQKIVAGAALDAGADVQIIEHLSQGRDHPVSLHFPEGAYLKGLVCVKA